MSKGSGGTRATNSSNTHKASTVSTSVSKFNAIKLDSVSAFDTKHNAMTNVLGVPIGYASSL